MSDDSAPHVSAARIFAAFLKLGLTSFGGPVAHLGYFRRDLVERRGWISETAYAELVALCQFLPGPASSQTGFAIGLRLGGAQGGLAAFAGFTLPSALLMLAAAWGAGWMEGEPAAALMHGLKLVAVCVVGHAVVMMARAHCRSAATVLLAALALVFLVTTQHALAAPAAILAAALSGALAGGSRDVAMVAPARTGTRRGLILFGVFLALLGGLPLLRQFTDAPFVELADGFYRAGALVFGGGHVVLPLLQAETAATISAETFLAGYGAAQALPGPLFAFAGYLGAVATPAAPSVSGGLIALAFIFLPGFLLVAAILPIWARIRAQPRAAGAVRHANAAVVGVLAAAWWSPVATAGVVSTSDALIAAAGFGALLIPRLPVIVVVGAVASLGASAYLAGAV